MLLKDNRKNNFFWIENKVIDSEELDTYEKLIYIVLVRFCDKNSSCYPSIATISKKAHCSEKKAKNTIKSLIEKGLIQKINRIRENGQLNSNVYYVNSIDDLIGNDIPNIGNDIPNIGNDIPRDRVPGSHDIGYDVPINNTYINNTYINIEDESLYMDFNFIDESITHVKLKKSDYDKLVNKFTQDVINNKILQLENYIVNGKGKKYKNHYLVLLNWCRNLNLSSDNTKQKSNSSVSFTLDEFKTY